MSENKAENKAAASSEKTKTVGGAARKRNAAAAKKKSPPKGAHQPANIQFVGKRKKINKTSLKSEIYPKEIPGFVVDGGEKIIIPVGIEKGVFMEPSIAARLIGLFPDDFKVPTSFGGKLKNGGK